MAELAPEPYLALHPADAAARWALTEGQPVALVVGGAQRTLPLARCTPRLPAAWSRLPAGLPGMSGIGAAGLGARLLRQQEERR